MLVLTRKLLKLHFEWHSTITHFDGELSNMCMKRQENFMLFLFLSALSFFGIYHINFNVCCWSFFLLFCSHKNIRICIFVCGCTLMFNTFLPTHKVLLFYIRKHKKLYANFFWVIFEIQWSDNHWTKV